MEVKQEIELENKARDVWLIKVPGRIADKWDELAKDPTNVDGHSLGHVKVFSKGEGEELKLTFHVKAEENTNKNSKAPIFGNDFSLQFNKMTDKMHVFSRGDGGVKVEGAVEQRFFMQPISNFSYNTSSAKASEGTYGVTKEIGIWEGLQSKSKPRVIQMENKRDDSDDDSDRNTKRRKLAHGDDTAALRNAIFDLFASKDREGNKREYWQFKELKRELRDAPNNHPNNIRAVLKNICEFHKFGDHAKCYSLKNEYR